MLLKNQAFRWGNALEKSQFVRIDEFEYV